MEVGELLVGLNILYVSVHECVVFRFLAVIGHWRNRSNGWSIVVVNELVTENTALGLGSKMRNAHNPGDTVDPTKYFKM